MLTKTLTLPQIGGDAAVRTRGVATAPETLIGGDATEKEVDGEGGDGCGGGGFLIVTFRKITGGGGVAGMVVTEWRYGIKSQRRQRRC
ncbi:hypothetical protein R6Q59_027637 [Mikania micrantha]